MGRATATRAPATRKPQHIEPGDATGVPVTHRHHPRLVRCHLQPTRAETWLQLWLEAVVLLLLLKRSHKIVRIPDQTGLPATAGLDHLLKPQVEGIVPIDIGQDG
jgi:hypothetical protein